MNDTNAPRLPLWRRRATVTMLLALYFLVASNWLHPLLRFSSQNANAIATLLGFSLGWVALAPLWMQQAKVMSRVYLTLMILPFVIYTTMLGYGIARNLGAEDTPVVAKIQMAHGYRVSLYRIALADSSGIAVQQERDLLPGIMAVKRLPGFYPASSATYTVSAPDELSISVPAYAPDRPETAVTLNYSLKPYLYF
jgi:hypothetical protein